MGGSTGACYLFQSTLPRGERLATSPQSQANKRISIHAPARGATVYFDIDRRNGGISIHAPARGATAILPPFLLYSSNFNPRSREGSDVV